jgi:hypothetical protein
LSFSFFEELLPFFAMKLGKLFVKTSLPADGGISSPRSPSTRLTLMPLAFESGSLSAFLGLFDLETAAAKERLAIAWKTFTGILDLLGIRMVGFYMPTMLAMFVVSHMDLLSMNALLASCQNSYPIKGYCILWKSLILK